MGRLNRTKKWGLHNRNSFFLKKKKLINDDQYISRVATIPVSKHCYINKIACKDAGKVQTRQKKGLHNRNSFFM